MAISSAQWVRIEQLLPQALELPAPRRDAFLDKHCDGDAALLAELQALVRASTNTDEFLDRPVALGAPDVAAPEESLPAGTLLGAWRVGEPIGHGGMARVYAATRADGLLEMSAALKVLKRGLDTDALLARFQRERRILARLSHPNIAHLLDAGATADGRPYFVMERVDGEPITEHCARVGAGVPAILRLVIQACQAVSAAHRERIVHRDLKPSNLLVTTAGEIKLLDFGIAKAFADGGDATMTSAEARLLTPSHAAPEQILGGTITPATDVYALGVILFQLLTGQLPHRRDGVPLAVLAMELRHETTSRPSLALQRATTNLPTQPQRQRRRRARELAGDLDHIVLKAMHAEPERRYASAFDLAEDLHRHLEHRPVLARPDSTAYRIGRFVRRYPVPVAAAGIAVLAVVGGLAASLWQAARAQRNLETAQAVSAFVTQDLLASVDPDQRSTANITLKEMLEIAAPQIDRRFADRPDVAAQLHHALGQSYGGLGLQEERRVQQAAAVALFEQVAGADGESTLKARHELGLALKELGDLAGALAAHETVHRGWLERGEPERAEALLARLEIASLKEALGGELAPALAEIRAVTEALERTGAPVDALRLAQSKLADHLETAAEYGEAEALYRKLLESLAQRPANRYLMRPRLMGALAHVLLIRGRYDEADRTLAQLRAELSRLVPPTHTQFRILGMYEALLHAEQGRFADAETAATALLDPKSELWTMVARSILADVQVRSGRAAQGAKTARLVLDAQKEFFPPEDSSFVQVSALLAEALRLSGNARDAKQALEAGTAALPRLSPRHPLLAQYRRTQGLLWLAEGRRNDARAALAEALSSYEARLGSAHWRARRVREELARAGTSST